LYILDADGSSLVHENNESKADRIIGSVSTTADKTASIHASFEVMVCMGCIGDMMLREQARSEMKGGLIN